MYVCLSGVKMMKELTKIQQEILSFIKGRISSGLPPTLAEIADKFNYRNRSTVQQHLKAIEKKGYIRRDPKKSRGIEILIEDSLFDEKPVLGEVAAGNPLAIYPDSIDTINLPKIVRMPKDSFLLKVKGDSLIDAYIFDKDVVIVNPNLQIKEDQIIVAVLDDSAVVKRIKIKDKNKVELHSENPEYEPIIVDKEFQTFKPVGVVIGIYRSMEVN